MVRRSPSLIVLVAFVACSKDTTAPELGTSWASLAPGGAHVCALTNGGDAYCWGYNGYGQLGDSTTTDALTPRRVAGNFRFAAIYAGANRTCGLTSAGAAYCWGQNAYGSLGDGTETDRATPTPVVGAPAFERLTMRLSHTCGLTAAGAVFCWGRNTEGVLGLPLTTVIQPTAAPVPASVTFTTISAGSTHNCGLTSAGVMWCWGDGRQGELGDGTTQSRPTPAPVSGRTAFVALHAGGGYTCGLATSGRVYCSGWNAIGQLGDGTQTDRTTLVPITGGPNFSLIMDGSDRHGCGLTASGLAYCWGDNAGGEIGDGTTQMRLAPVRSAQGLVFRSLAGGTYFTCGLAGDGAYCWGDNRYGQLGDGTVSEFRDLPVRVPNPQP